MCWVFIFLHDFIVLGLARDLFCNWRLNLLPLVTIFIPAIKQGVNTLSIASCGWCVSSLDRLSVGGWATTWRNSIGMADTRKHINTRKNSLASYYIKTHCGLWALLQWILVVLCSCMYVGFQFNFLCNCLFTYEKIQLKFLFNFIFILCYFAQSRLLFILGC